MKKSLHHKRKYTVVFQAAKEGGYVVHVPALPGCHTQGDTLEEAEKNAKEAIDCYLLSLNDMGEAIPEEQSGTKIITVATEINFTE